MNIVIVLRDSIVNNKSSVDLKNVLYNSLKIDKPGFYRIDNPEWLDKEHKELKVGIKLDVNSQSDKEKYNQIKNQAMEHIIEMLVEFLQTEYSCKVEPIEAFHMNDNHPSLDLKKIEFLTDRDEDVNSPNCVAFIKTNRSG